VIYKDYYIANRVDRADRAITFLEILDVYLKDHSPYLDSSFPCSKSQNTIRVNLLGNHSTSYYYVVNLVLISIYLAH